MRLDKFLQTSRIIKRRAVANELCDRGRVLVNDQAAKAGKELKPGDRITLSLGADGKFVCEVVELPTRGIRKEQAAGLYRTISDSRIRSVDL